MLPLQVLRQSGLQAELMVDCKNGESYDGTLQACDTFMNLKLSGVTITSAHGAFSKCEQLFIRGNNIKSIQFAPEVLDRHQVEVKRKQAEALEAKVNKRKEKSDAKEASRVEKAAAAGSGRGRGASASSAMRGGFTGGRGAPGSRGRGGSEHRGGARGSG